MRLNISRSPRPRRACRFLFLPLLFMVAVCGRLVVPAAASQSNSDSERAGSPIVDKSTVRIDAVKRGGMLVQASGLGNLRDIGEGHFEAHLLIPGWAFNEVDTGQSATTNTRKGIVSGKVIHKYSMKDNGVFQVDLSLEGHLPEGLRNDMPVDGSIQLGRIEDVLFVRQPAFAPPNSKVSVFKVAEDGKTATRVLVEFGRPSANTIQVVNGLQAGDKIILSDMSRYDLFDSIRLN